jgi:hypothetical protein
MAMTALTDTDVAPVLALLPTEKTAYSHHPSEGGPSSVEISSFGLAFNGTGADEKEASRNAVFKLLMHCNSVYDIAESIPCSFASSPFLALSNWLFAKFAHHLKITGSYDAYCGNVLLGSGKTSMEAVQCALVNLNKDPVLLLELHIDQPVLVQGVGWGVGQYGDLSQVMI